MQIILGAMNMFFSLQTRDTRLRGEKWESCVFDWTGTTDGRVGTHSVDTIFFLSIKYSNLLL